MKHPQDMQKSISTNFSHFNVSLQRHTHTPTNGHTLVLSLALSRACKCLSVPHARTRTQRGDCDAIPRIHTETRKV